MTTTQLDAGIKHTDDRAWRAVWRKILAGCSRRIFLVDLDGTIWDDILVLLNQQFGPLDDDGKKKWLQYDHAYKVVGTMSNGAHLEAEYRDLLGEKPLEELVAWLRANHRPVPGVRRFLSFLANNNISVVAISNGARQFADAMFAHHGITMPFVSNSLLIKNDRFVRLDFFHDEEEGVRKGALVSMAVELGYEVVGCAGDSKGDIRLVTQTARAGGLVIAVNNHGLSRWCEENEAIIGLHNWVAVCDYADAIKPLQERIGGC